MKILSLPVIAIAAAAATGLAAFAEQDRATLKVLDGLSFGEFKGYEDWTYVAPSQTDKVIKVIAANPLALKAYRSGLPKEGAAFPEGSRMVKLEWSRKLDPNAPGPVYVPDQLQAVEFMVKDSKRFPNNGGGWGYALFKNDPASNTLTPVGSGTACGNACHTRVATRDFVFTSYPPR